MSRQTVFCFVLISVLFCTAPCAMADDATSFKKACEQLKKSWLAINQLPASKQISSARDNIKQALVAIYTAQGKDFRAKWLAAASVKDVSESIQRQTKGTDADFPELFLFEYTAVKKEPNGSFLFKQRWHCSFSGKTIDKNSPKHSICLQHLPNIRADGEWHEVPKSFPDIFQ